MSALAAIYSLDVKLGFSCLPTEISFGPCDAVQCI